MIISTPRQPISMLAIILMELYMVCDVTKDRAKNICIQVKDVIRLTEKDYEQKNMYESRRRARRTCHKTYSNRHHCNQSINVDFLTW
jgi:hypothetical protein